MQIEEFVTQGFTRAGWVGDEGGGALLALWTACLDSNPSSATC